MSRTRTALRRLWPAAKRRPSGPLFEILGDLQLGDDVMFATGPVQTHIAVGPAAKCSLGDRLFIGHGTSISCETRVVVGSDTRLGPFTILFDSDFHTAGAHDLRKESARKQPPPKTGSVSIGCGVIIGECVTILRGTTIGDGATIDPGSVVWGTIAAGARVTGDPKKSGSP